MMPAEQGDALERESRYNRIYLSIIERYKDYIEEKESLSVAELPTMITPKEPLIVKKAEEIKASFSLYTYDLNFMEAANKAFNFVKEQIEEMVLPLQFWLSPKETLSFMMGDAVDRSLLLCSLLIALGNASAKVLMIMADEKERKVFVHCEFNERLYLFNMEDKIEEFGTPEEMIMYAEINENATAYEFNDHAYYDIT
jgi:hypothetical protein